MGFSIYDELSLLSDDELTEIKTWIGNYLRERKEEREEEAKI